MRAIQFGLGVLMLVGVALPQDTRAGESKSYWDHGWSKDCYADRRQMMSTARERAFNWCRSRGGVNRKRTEFIFVVDKGQKLGPSFKTHYCEVKGTITCN